MKIRCIIGICTLIIFQPNGILASNIENQTTSMRLFQRVCRRLPSNLSLSRTQRNEKSKSAIDPISDQSTLHCDKCEISPPPKTLCNHYCRNKTLKKRPYSHWIDKTLFKIPFRNSNQNLSANGDSDDQETACRQIKNVAPTVDLKKNIDHVNHDDKTPPIKISNGFKVNQGDGISPAALELSSYKSHEVHNTPRLVNSDLNAEFRDVIDISNPPNHLTECSTISGKKNEKIASKHESKESLGLHSSDIFFNRGALNIENAIFSENMAENGLRASKISSMIYDSHKSINVEPSQITISDIRYTKNRDYEHIPEELREISAKPTNVVISRKRAPIMGVLALKMRLGRGDQF